MKNDARIVSTFAVAGLLVPCGMFFVWRLAMQDEPVLTLTTFHRLADILRPGRRLVYVGTAAQWSGESLWAAS
jgi:hypothetical protein